MREMAGELRVTDNLDELIGILPEEIAAAVRREEQLTELLEVILDLGRQPEARFPDRWTFLSERLVTFEDLEYVTARVGEFGRDNRAGIERTLHRISGIRNRLGRIVGLTCRVGRAVFGTIDIIRDVVEQGNSTLLLGRPGIGKTTKLREIARVLADDLMKRVVVVDTSNEIAGDGDIPHPAIGHARRMQVPRPELQHAVMIEAVENHMPEVIVIDEIGTELEAFAARTIAERGVQLIGTAHGNTLDNLIMNPTLCDLVGGIQAVTLSDEEARRRATQKTVLERKAPPTFDTVIEMIEMDRLAVHHQVGRVVDEMLKGNPPTPEIRVRQPDGRIRREYGPPEPTAAAAFVGEPGRAVKKVFSYGLSRDRVERAIHRLHLPLVVTKEPQEADYVLTLRAHANKFTRGRWRAHSHLPLLVARANTSEAIETCLRDSMGMEQGSEEEVALREAREAIEHVLTFSEPVELSAQSARLRRLQHELAQQYNLQSLSVGKEPYRRVQIFHVKRRR